MVVFEFTNYRNYLKAILAEKCAHNTKYSLRAFASHLGINPSQLSRLFNGTNRISQDRAFIIADTLKLKGKQKEYFCNLVALDLAKTQSHKELIESRLKNSNPSKKVHILELDAFRIVSDWYHHAILALTQTKNFNSDSQWIAKRLHVSKAEVEVALERLKRLKLLTEKNKKLVKATDTNLTASALPHEALQKFHEQTLEHAQNKLKIQDMNERHMSSVIFAIDPKKLKEAYEKIRQFRYEMQDFLAEGTKTEVYQLAVQLFRLTHGGKDHENKK